MSLASDVPEKFCPENGMAADAWAVSVQSYFLISGLSSAKTNDPVKLAFVISRLGPDALYWYTSVFLKANSKPEKADDLITAICEHYEKKEDLYSVRDRLRNIKFSSLDQFIADYLGVAASSPLSQDELVYFFTDRMNGVYATELRRQPPTTLYDAVKVVRALKAARHPPASPFFSSSSSQPFGTGSSSASSSSSGRPWRSNHETSPNPPSVKKIASLITTVDADVITTPVQFSTKGKIDAVVDSGADSSFISSSLVQKLGFHIRKTGSLVMFADGRTCEALGEVTVPAYILKERRLITFTVADIAQDIVLGMPWLQSAQPVIDWKDGSVKPRAV